MKRKTSQKTRLSCQTDLVVRSSRQGETIFCSCRASRYNFLYRLRVFIDHFTLIALSIWCLLFLFSSSYLVKFLGALTRVVRLATRP